MEKIVALCKRRGFIFQSSEIYGGLASTYDYGHYGVLLKNNVKGEWWRAVVQERDDMVALDAAILMHPRTWEASGHLESFTDPLVQCRASARSAGGRTTSSPGEDGELRCPECGGELGEAREFNLMFETFMGPVRDDAARIFLRPETAQGIFVNFKNVLQFARKQAAVRDRPDRQGVPQRDHARQLHLPHARVRADGDRVLRAAGRGGASGTSAGWTIACAGTPTSASGPTTCSCASTAPTSCRITRPATSDIEYLFPMGWSELEGIANRTDFDLTPHAEFSGEELDVRRHGDRRALRPVRDRALRRARTAATLAFMVDAYDEEEVAGRKRTVLRLHPRLAPVKVAVLPLVSTRRHAREGAHDLRGAARA